MGSVVLLTALQGGRQFHRLAVGRMEKSTSPGLQALAHVLPAHKTFLDAEPFQGVEPVLVVGLPQVWIASGLRRLDLWTQGHRPFSPGEAAGFRQTHGQG